MNLSFKNIFMMFFSLFIFVSNGVAQETSADSLDQDFLEAVQDGDIEYATELLQLGADIDATDERGRNALMLNTDNEKNRIEVLEFLIAEGIDINAEDEDGYTALGYYFNYDGTIHSAPYERKVLLKAGARWSDLDQRFVLHVDSIRSADSEPSHEPILNELLRIRQGPPTLNELLRTRRGEMRIRDIIERVPTERKVVLKDTQGGRANTDLLEEREWGPAKRKDTQGDRADPDLLEELR